MSLLIDDPRITVERITGIRTGTTQYQVELNPVCSDHIHWIDSNIMAGLTAAGAILHADSMRLFLVFERAATVSPEWGDDAAYSGEHVR